MTPKRLLLIASQVLRPLSFGACSEIEVVLYLGFYPSIPKTTTTCLRLLGKYIVDYYEMC